jgi:hypothetical protein
MVRFNVIKYVQERMETLGLDPDVLQKDGRIDDPEVRLHKDGTPSRISWVLPNNMRVSVAIPRVKKGE